MFHDPHMAEFMKYVTIIWILFFKLMVLEFTNKACFIEKMCRKHFFIYLISKKNYLFNFKTY